MLACLRYLYGPPSLLLRALHPPGLRVVLCSSAFRHGRLLP